MDVSAISNSLGRSVAESERNVRSHMATMNPADPMDELRLQASMSAYSTLLHLDSTIIKAIHEALNGIIKNIA